MMTRTHIRFTVGIPTLQRGRTLSELIGVFDADESVDEVLIVNNADQEFPIEPRYTKVRILDQPRNIFVNPAWNLIAQEARSSHLAISNDDILIGTDLLTGIANFLDIHRVGMLGPHRDSFETATQDQLKFTPAYGLPYGYGTLMFLPRENYVPIPDDYKIWYGDNWLFHSQRRRNWSFRAPIRTTMGTSSSSPEFASMWNAETRRFDAEGAPTTYGSAFRVESSVHRSAVRLRDALKRPRGQTPGQGGPSSEPEGLSNRTASAPKSQAGRSRH